MRDQRYSRYQQKDIKRLWVGARGWLYLGDLVRVDYACWKGSPTAMVIGFVVDPAPVALAREIRVALQPAVNQSSTFFYPHRHCKKAKVRKAKK